MSGSAQLDEFNQAVELLNNIQRAAGPLVKGMTRQQRQNLIEAPADVLASTLRDCFRRVQARNCLKQFNPATFFGKGWLLRKDDPRSADVGVLSAKRMLLVPHLKGNETQEAARKRRKQIARV